MNLQIFSDFFGQGKVLFWAFLVREVDFSNVFNCLGLSLPMFSYHSDKSLQTSIFWFLSNNSGKFWSN